MSIPADPHDPAWHEARRGFIGASEAAAVLGLSPWATPLDVWALKTGLIEPDPPTIATDLGHELEDFIARRWAKQADRCVHAPRDTRRHLELPHIAASVDREACAPDGTTATELLECKLVGPLVAWAWKDGPPVYVQVQVQVQMAVTGAERVHVAALLADPAWDLRSWTIERDDDAIATILGRLDAWWQRHIVGGERAGLEGDPGRVREMLQRLHPRGEADLAVRLDGVATETLDVLRRAKALRKDIDCDIEAAENLLRAALGDATEGYTDDNAPPVVTWRPQTRTGHDLKAIHAAAKGDAAAEQLDEFTVEEIQTAARVLDAVRTETTTRVLRIAAPRRGDRP